MLWKGTETTSFKIFCENKHVNYLLVISETWTRSVVQREASEQPGKLRIFHVQLRLITVVSRPVPFPTGFVALSYGTLRSFTVLTPFYFVCQVMLQLSRRVKFKNIKWHIMGTSSVMLEQSLCH